MIDCCVPRKWPDLNKLAGAAPAPTWRSPIQRLTKVADPDYEWLQRIADASIPLVRDAFLKAIARIKGSIREAELRAALEAGDVNRALGILDIDGAMADALKPDLIPPLEDVFIETGRETPARVVGGQLGMRFDLSNPNVARFLKDYDLGLIRQVSQESRDAIKRVVTRAVSGVARNGNPRAQAKEIVDHIGLTDRQAQAATAYKDALEQEGRKADQIERMAAKYRQRALKRRAETIARTETQRAAHAGRQASIEQAADEGLLDRATLRQRWLVTPDDRLCVYCAAIPALNVDGRRLGEPFATPVGPVAYPPAHPQCRCTLVISAGL